MSAAKGYSESVSIFEALEPRLLLSGSIAEALPDHVEMLYFDPAPDLLVSGSLAASAPAPQAAALLPLDQTFLLHSTPGASKVIYLDFDGHTTSGTEWNTEFTGGDDFTSPAYSYQGDSSFSDAEKERIQKIWQRVAEDYIPFDVDVTTEDPGSAALMKAGLFDQEWGVRVVIGGNSSDWYEPGAGGVAYVGSFDWGSDTPVFAFPKNLSNSEKYIAEAVSHEVGHAVGLHHDGTGSEEYYGGHGSGATGWAPIMGTGYYKELVQWGTNEYPGADNPEDDLAIIVSGNGFGYRSDDYGDTRQAAEVLLEDAGHQIFAYGVIERNNDLDFFAFTTTSGTITLNVDPFENGPNLDILASLYDSTGTLVASDNSVSVLDAGFNIPLLAGTYYLSVEGTGKNPIDTGYSDYGSLGQYYVSGTLGGPDVVDAGIVAADINFDIALPYDDDSVTITAAVRNLGTVDLSDLAVRFYDGDPGSGGVQIGSDYMFASLGGMSSGEAQVVWTPGWAGPHDIYVVVDPDDAIDEDIENNNAAYKTISVSDDDTDGPEIYNVTVVEHNGDGDGIIAADEQMLISWELTDSIARGLLVTEVSIGVEDSVEIQNVWDQSIDTTGWTVLLNDPIGPAPDINAVNPNAWTLGVEATGAQVLFRTEDPGSGADYLGGDINWDIEAPGWAMILDDSGEIQDFAVWGYSAVEIAAMSVDYGGFIGITPGEHWSGDGIETSPPGAPEPGPAGAAIVYSGGTYSENFDSMGPSGTTSPTGWIAGNYSDVENRQPPGSAPDDESLYVDDGSSTNKGRSYNYGTTGDSDRAIGEISTTSSGDRAVQLAITNSTGAEITELALSYAGEQWRDWSSGADQVLTVWFSTSPGSGFASMGSQFDFHAPSNAGAGSAIDGNDPANRAEISGLFVPASPIAEGQTFYITWHDINDRGVNDHALAIDDVSVTPVFQPPDLFLARTGYDDNNSGVDFVAGEVSTLGSQNPGLVDSSGIGPVELLIDGAPAAMSGDYYAVVGPLASDGSSPLEHSFTINAGDGDNSPTYSQFVGSVQVSPSEEITVLHESLPLVSEAIGPIDFGQVDPGSPVVEKTFEIRNDGAQTLLLGVITAPSGFSVTQPALSEIPAGGSAPFTVTFDTANVGAFSGDVTIASSDGAQSPDGLAENPFRIAIIGTVGSPASIAGRHVFYNNSSWDAGGDDSAIATDKTALLAGQIAGPSNYTNYHLGVNGMMVDIDSPSGTPSGSDFTFRVNQADNPDTWSQAPVPTISVQSGAGPGGSDRVTLVWDDGAIVNQWLEVTVLATGQTGLGADDVFYFGNVVGEVDGDGEVGDSDYDVLVSQFGMPGSIASLASDINASGQVDLADFSIMRSAFGNIVQMPTPVAPAPPAPAAEPQTGADLLEESFVSVSVSESKSEPLGPALRSAAVEPEAIAILTIPADSTVRRPLDIRPADPHRTGIDAQDLRALDNYLLSADGDGLPVDLLAESALGLVL
jgi:hypothetical protein